MGDSEGVYSAYVCRDNSELVVHVMQLYAWPGMKIADVTWGKGVFWKKIDLSLYDFHKSDLLTVPGHRYDFRDLPYKSNEFDLLVLDPPYAHNPGQMIVNANYKNAETTRGMYHDDIIGLYRDGLKEAKRVVKEGGLVFVKCQDEVESGYQRWSHMEIVRDALALGLYGRDLFVLVQEKFPHIQHLPQQHARKRHSYLLVLRKPEKSDEKALERYGVLRALVRKPHRR